jgi:metal-responsive CopG/Arc/MetJ family transcriptional regulator
MNAKKIAASVPAAQFQALERLRRRLHLKRSQAIQEALALWLSAREGDARVEQYLRGYLAHPEDAREGRALTRAWSTGLEPEDW